MKLSKKKSLEKKKAFSVSHFSATKIGSKQRFGLVTKSTEEVNIDVV